MGAADSGDSATTLERCRDPGFTPGVRDVGELLAQWQRAQVDLRGSPRRALDKRVVAALARGERGVGLALIDRWSQAGDEQRVLRLQALRRLAVRVALPELTEVLTGGLQDASPRVVREAARAVGKLGLDEGSVFEPLLLAVCRDGALPQQRAAVEALGRIAEPSALEALRALPRDDDDLARRTTEAVTLIGRRANRDRAGSAALGIALPRPTSVWLRCRAGAAATVEDQVRTLLLPEHPQLGVTRRGRAAVEITWGGTLAQLYRVRSFVDVALSFPLPDGATVVDRVLAGLDHPELVAALQAWTAGPIRFRLAFAQGRRRAAVWTVAKTLAERGSALVNDSRAVAWTIEVDEQHGRLWCVPKGADPRFRYRLADVPAATHPTLAALMAWVGRPQPGEVVWDPFCGTGTELIECATVSTGLHLWGTEVEAEALAGARRNVAAAGIESASLQLVHGSALDTRPRHEGRGVSLILSNPPMGRRVMVEGRGMRRLLDDFVAHAARLLHPGGRVVWLSPAPRATAASARHLGLHVEDLDVIDMGGFFTTPQVLRRDG